MLVHLDPRRLVHHARHLDRGLAAHEPGAERGAVAEVIEKAAAAGCLLVPPGIRFLGLDLFGRDFHLAGEMEQGAAVAAVIVHLNDIADRAVLDQPLRRDVRGIPGDRPVDRETTARPLHGGQHAARVGNACREWLLDEDVEPVRRDALDSVGVLGGGGADDGEVGVGGGEAGLQIGEDPVFGNGELGDRFRHPGAVRMEHARDLGVRMLGHLAQQVAHVHVVEADPQDAVFRHDAQTPVSAPGVPLPEGSRMQHGPEMVNSGERCGRIKEQPRSR